ncbi:hypothetical protein D0862_13448 [Hortaea werneckii]|uniref:Uncharacterized protein n=1 Tax=Hortaea werneckii TaxID=91943 RepID=A0A3M7EN53_HORWE|nr:hypothetical protein D0862_13448 [Hortaea werneckii]
MFTKISFITLAATAAFVTTASARPASTSPAVDPTITAKPAADVYVDADDTEYCTADGVMYNCAWATAGVPDFKSVELVARDEEATSIKTSAAVPEASEAVEGDLSNIDQEPEEDPKLIDEDDDIEDDDYEDDEEYEDDEDEDEDSKIALHVPSSNLTTNATLLTPRGSSGTVKYCSGPGICATLPAGDKCTTFEKGYTSLTFSAGLECAIYAKQDCRKQLFKSKGKVGNVRGFIDTTTDPRAKKNKVGAAMSFKC